MKTQELIKTLRIAAEDNYNDIPLRMLILMAAERLEDLSYE